MMVMPEQQTKVRLTLRDALGEWTEEYIAPKEQEHQKWANQIVYNFNEKRRQGEFERTLVKVEVVSDGETLAATAHDWKDLGYGTGWGERYQCLRCGITGMRKVGVWPPKADAEFRTRWFKSCDEARDYLPLDPEQRARYRNRKLGQERSDRAWRERRGW